MPRLLPAASYQSPGLRDWQLDRKGRHRLLLHAHFGSVGPLWAYTYRVPALEGQLSLSMTAVVSRSQARRLIEYWALRRETRTIRPAAAACEE